MQIAYHGMHEAVVVPALNRVVEAKKPIECTPDQARGLLIQTDTWRPVDAEAKALLATLTGAPVNEEVSNGDR